MITTRAVLDASVGENLDRLVTVDTRGDELARIVYGAARALTSEPLSVAGARFLLDKLPTGGTALILTGFRIPPTGVPETDGVIGAAVLAYALVKARQAVPVFVCEPEVIPALAASVRATGLAVADTLDAARALPYTVAILPFGVDESAARAATLAAELTPDVVVAVERAGRNAKGECHFAGGANVTAAIADIDALYAACAAAGVPTLAVGDVGNELGMGAIADVVKTEIAAGGNCGCGCGGGIANEAPADLTVACTVSDWGAYALAAGLGHLVADPAVLIDARGYRRVIEACVAQGAIDGTSRLAIPHIDGVSDEYNCRLLEQMRDVVAWPNRPQMDNAGRAFRAARLSAN